MYRKELLKKKTRQTSRFPAKKDGMYIYHANACIHRDVDENCSNVARLIGLASKNGGLHRENICFSSLDVIFGKRLSLSNGSLSAQRSTAVSLFLRSAKNSYAMFVFLPRMQVCIWRIKHR